MKVLIACGAGFNWSDTGAARHPQHGRTVENRSIVTSPFTVPEREVVTLRLRVRRVQGRTGGDQKRCRALDPSALRSVILAHTRSGNQAGGVVRWT
jgi:hypothetical protein